MANSLVQELIEAGVHFGQRASGWNPKMEPYIYGKRNGIHIIDIRETIKGLLLAKRYLGKVVSSGKDVCFVGTKRQSKPVLEQHVGNVGMHWVTERWLGGTLTNHRTIRSRLKRLEELEQIQEQDNFASYSKKMESQLRREKRKIERNLGGIRKMEKLPGVMVVIDVQHELTALKEARKLGIPAICLIDTDGDPDLADIPIPGNDDSMRAIDVIVRELCAAIAEAKQTRQASAEGADDPEPASGGKQQPRRSRRAQYRAGAEESGGASSEQDGSATTPASPGAVAGKAT